MADFTVTPEVVADQGAFETLVRLEVLDIIMSSGSNRQREEPLPALESFSEAVLKPYRESRPSAHVGTPTPTAGVSEQSVGYTRHDAIDETPNRIPPMRKPLKKPGRRKA